MSGLLIYVFVSIPYFSVGFPLLIIKFLMGFFFFNLKQTNMSDWWQLSTKPIIFWGGKDREKIKNRDLLHLASIFS